MTGEHGIGVEKISFMCPPEVQKSDVGAQRSDGHSAADAHPGIRRYLFSATDIEVMSDVRKVFNPDGRCSPGKLLPTAGGCGMEQIDRSKPGRRAAL